MTTRITDNFDLREFACRGELPPPSVRGSILALCDQLEILRAILGRPITITSGWRSVEYNRTLPGAARSQHLDGVGCDFKVAGLDARDLCVVVDCLIQCGVMEEGGLGSYRTHVHYDLRGERARWRA
jgi:uncharacterized protein YcbK (DUF882 family)